MSASGDVEKLRDATYRQQWILTRFGVRFKVGPVPRRRGGWMTFKDATSPVSWYMNRLREAGVFKPGCPDADDIPIVFRGKKALICDVARSKMFNTPLVVYPIDITAMRVSFN